MTTLDTLQWQADMLYHGLADDPELWSEHRIAAALLVYAAEYASRGDAPPVGEELRVTRAGDLWQWRLGWTDYTTVSEHRGSQTRAASGLTLTEEAAGTLGTLAARGLRLATQTARRVRDDDERTTG